jgi:hypothetical protein
MAVLSEFESLSTLFSGLIGSSLRGETYASIFDKEALVRGVCRGFNSNGFNIAGFVLYRRIL